MRIALAALIAVAAAACNLPDDAASDGGTGFEDVPSGCIVVDITLSPEKIDLVSELAHSFNDDKVEVDGDCVFVRPQRKSSGGAEQAARRRVGRGRGRARAGRVVAVRQHVGQGAQPAPRRPGRAPDGDGRRAVHAHAARHRHARADGLGPRLPGHAGRVLRHPRPRPQPAGVGGVRPSRVGAVPPRQDEPELLHERPQRAHRPVVRGHRQDREPVVGGSRQARGDRLRQGRRVGRRALRRHHPHVPQQLVPGRPAQHRAHLRLGGRRRGEVGDRLQPRQPRRHPRHRREAPSPEDPLGGRVPQGRDDLLRQPVHRPRRAVGGRARRRRAPGCSRTSSSRPRTSARCSSSASGPATPRWPPATRSSSATASTRTSRRRCSRCPTRR